MATIEMTPLLHSLGNERRTGCSGHWSRCASDLPPSSWSENTRHRAKSAASANLYSTCCAGGAGSRTAQRREGLVRPMSMLCRARDAIPV